MGARGRHFAKIGLPTERLRAIDLSCRACGAGVWALGLDSRLGTFGFSPTSDIYTYKTKLKLEKEVGGGGGISERSREPNERTRGTDPLSTALWLSYTDL